MSCQNSHNTDHPGTLPCNRNNCRCGSSENCMYYNDGDKSHYNYVAVAGSGSKDDARYRCAYKAYDMYNAENMYGDHALGKLGTYTSEYGKINQSGFYGRVNYDDANCSEYPIGKRDACDNCPKDQQNFMPPTGNGDFDLGLDVDGQFYGVEVSNPLMDLVKMAVIGAIAFYAWKNKNNLRFDAKTLAMLAVAFYAFKFFF